MPGYLQEEGINPRVRHGDLRGDPPLDQQLAVAGRARSTCAPASACPRRVSEIAIQFKCPPGTIFAQKDGFDLAANTLSFQIQPDEGLGLILNAKIPGLETRTQPVKMSFRYATTFGSNTPEAYERLVLDAMIGDGTLFIRGDEAETSWKLYTPVLDFWQAQGRKRPGQLSRGLLGPRGGRQAARRRGATSGGSPDAAARRPCPRIFDALPGIEVPVGSISNGLAADVGGRGLGGPALARAASTSKATQVNFVLHLGFRTDAEDAVEPVRDRGEVLAPLSVPRRRPLPPAGRCRRDEMRAKVYGECTIGKSKDDTRCCEFVMLSYPRSARALPREPGVDLPLDRPSALLLGPPVQSTRRSWPTTATS